ncbi:mobilization protein MobS [uncultured Psychrobacter sp.]|uniref:mobilization protein MobS n=1 Tax=uncultured Psychrobacter sp. TaxID=259303 RepID=UPI002615DB4E|nr:mobilization protein MobS [uncultured Psychrobacter sp.]
MSLIDSSDMKEQQRINELQQKIAREKAKLDKKLTRKKILLGAFLIEALEDNAVDDLRDYTAKNLPKFLTRETDRKLLSDLVVSLGGSMTNDEEKNPDDTIGSSNSMLDGLYKN